MKKLIFLIISLIFASLSHGATGTGVSFTGASVNPWAFLSTSPTWSVSGGVASNLPTEGADALAGWDFTNWTPAANTTIIDLNSFSTTSNGYVSKATMLTVGQWYRGVLSGSSTAPIVTLYDGTASANNQLAALTASRTNRPTNAALIVRNSAAGTTDITALNAYPLTLSTLFATHSSSRSDVLPSVKITKTSGTDGKQAGLITNLDSATSPANFLLWYLDGSGNCKLDKAVAGVYTSVISAACTYVAGKAIQPSKVGTAVSLTYNGNLIGSGTVEDVGIISNTFHGLFSTSSTNSFSDYDSH